MTKRLGLSHSLALELRDPETWLFMKSTVSDERIRQELHKMFSADTASSIRFFTSNCCSLMTIDILFGGDASIWLKPSMEKRS